MVENLHHKSVGLRVQVMQEGVGNKIIQENDSIGKKIFFYGKGNS